MFGSRKQLVFIISLFICVISAYESYQGYVKYRIYTGNDTVRAEIKKLADKDQIDIWKFPARQDLTIDFLSSPMNIGKVEKLIKDFNITQVHRDRSVARRVFQNYKENNRATVSANSRSKRSVDNQKGFQHKSYLRFNDIAKILNELNNTKPFVFLEELGKTVEGREIFLIKIEKNKGTPSIWLDAGIHAREWISSASALYLIDQLLNNSTELAEKFTWYIIPLLNPDGYDFTHKRSRLWRKNRNLSNKCVGVDLNRNFPFQWQNPSRNSECADTYSGSGAGSEVESAAVISTLARIHRSSKLVGFFTIHSYGQFLLTAYGYKSMTYPSHYEELMLNGLRASYMIRKEFGTSYTVGSASDLLYEASGGSDDYVTDKYNLTYSYTIELPDQGRHGFVLPPIYIKVVGKQLISLLTNILSNYKD